MAKKKTRGKISGHPVPPPVWTARKYGMLSRCERMYPQTNLRAHGRRSYYFTTGFGSTSAGFLPLRACIRGGLTVSVETRHEKENQTLPQVK